MTDRQKRTQERFSCGVIHATPGALDALVRNRQNVVLLLARHVRADAKIVRKEGRNRNVRGQKQGSRFYSAFTLHDGTSLRIVTELSLATTTLLLIGEE